MARIVLVLICGALVFVLVSQFAPHFIETYLPTANSEETEPTAEDTKAAAVKQKAAAKSKSGTASRPSPSRTTAGATAGAAPLMTPSSASAAADKPTDQPAAENRRPVVQVTSENATIYLTNTSGGPVVGRLTKGAVVEPVFVVSSAGQNWTFVSASNEELAGFMRSETLGRSKSANPPGK